MPLPELLEACPKKDCEAAQILLSGEDPRHNILSMAAGGYRCPVCGGYGWVFTTFGGQVFERVNEISTKQST